MYTFLVLGLIPGTDIQIGFWSWIIIMVAIMVVFKRYRQYFIKIIDKWWHQFDEDVKDMPRKPLPSNRLHLRGL